MIMHFPNREAAFAHLNNAGWHKICKGRWISPRKDLCAVVQPHFAEVVCVSIWWREIMTAEQLREIGEALFGPRWQSELARSLGMSPRHMRRLASGHAVLTDSIVADIAAVAAERRKEVDRAVALLGKVTA